MRIFDTNKYEHLEHLYDHFNDDTNGASASRWPRARYGDKQTVFIFDKTVLSYHEFMSSLNGSEYHKQSLTKEELRAGLAPYISDKIEWTWTSSHQHHKDLDTPRHYYGHKVAKDFILHTKKDVFT